GRGRGHIHCGKDEQVPENGGRGFLPRAWPKGPRGEELRWFAPSRSANGRGIRPPRGSGFRRNRIQAAFGLLGNIRVREFFLNLLIDARCFLWIGGAESAGELQ